MRPSLTDVAPEPIPLPIDPFLPSHDDPYPVYRYLRDHHPVLRVPDEEIERWTTPVQPGRPGLCVVSRYDDVEAILTDWGTYRSGYGCEGVGLIVSDPPLHGPLRKAAQELFTPKRLRVLEEGVAAKARELVDALRDRSEADLAEDVAWPLSLWAISELLAIPVADRPMLQRLYVDSEYGGKPELHDELVAYMYAMAAEHRANPGAGLMSELLRTVPSDRLSDKEGMSICRDVFEGGLDNPSKQIANALVALSRFPDQRAMLSAIADDPPAMKSAVNELIRFDSPVQRNSRLAARDVELHGVPMPRETEVMLLFGSANRDERRFEDPDRLDLTRPPQRSLAFGHGIHFCIGATLTRLLVGAALPLMLDAFPDYELELPVRRPRSQFSHGILQLPASLG